MFSFMHLWAKSWGLLNLGRLGWLSPKLKIRSKSPSPVSHPHWPSRLLRSHYSHDQRLQEIKPNHRNTAQACAYAISVGLCIGQSTFHLL